MNPPSSLTGAHRRTYQSIFQHPLAHNLGWSDVHALFRQLGEVEEEANGKFKVTRHGQVLVLPAARTKDVSDPDELMALRRFLEHSANGDTAEQPEEAANWLVIIDHREARIYRSAAPGAVAQQIRPRVPENYFRQAPRSNDPSRPPEKNDPAGYFEPVAAVLNGAGRILVFGSGTGRSSEMEQFTAWLTTHRPQLAKRIVASIIVDEHHHTEAQLLAKARAFYASLPVA